jgi:hypothetical protein
MWLATRSFLHNPFGELAHSSLGPWLVFAAHTGLSAAALVFIFVLVVTLLFSFLLLCAGDPRRMVATVLFLGPVAAFYAALHVGGLVALLGWPMLWVLQHVFGVSSDAVRWTASIMSINYASLGLVSIAAVALVIVAMGQGIWKRQHALQAARGKARLAWPSSSGQCKAGETADTHTASVARASYHRIAMIAGPLFAAAILLAGLLLAREQRSLLPLVCSAVSAAALFAVIYGIGQLLGALVDTFIDKMHFADHA